LLNGESWYAIWTRSNCERLVAQQLSAKGFSPFLPEVAALRPRSGRSRSQRARSTCVKPEPMFPGYLFVRDEMSKTRYVDMLSVRGIVRVLEDGWMRLTPIPDADIDAIQRIVESGAAVFPYPLLQHGDRVRVVEGPLSGIEGIFVKANQQKHCLVVTIDLLGRSVAVEIGGEDIVRCN
jgi:transcription termination/antitermination protein NusG